MGVSPHLDAYGVGDASADADLVSMVFPKHYVHAQVLGKSNVCVRVRVSESW
jgi:hypothetical protein